MIYDIKLFGYWLTNCAICEYRSELKSSESSISKNTTPKSKRSGIFAGSAGQYVSLPIDKKE